MASFARASSVGAHAYVCGRAMCILGGCSRIRVWAHYVHLRWVLTHTCVDALCASSVGAHAYVCGRAMCILGGCSHILYVCGCTMCILGGCSRIRVWVRYVHPRWVLTHTCECVECVNVKFSSSKNKNLHSL